MAGILHQTDEQLELYALGRLPEDGVAAVEEHLLVCSSCQEKLDDREAFALAMRQAIAGEPATAARRDWFGWLRQPTLSWAVGFTVLVVAAGLYWNSDSRSIPLLASLQLTAVRGEMPSTTEARETDLTLTDAPPDAALLRVEVIDFAGKIVWNSTLSTRGRGRVRVMKRLAPGDYFVRLYDAAGKFLHEYGFHTRSAIKR